MNVGLLLSDILTARGTSAKAKALDSKEVNSVKTLFLFKNIKNIICQCVSPKTLSLKIYF